MTSLLIVGGSKGIGKALLQKELEHRHVINISRSAPGISHANLTHYSLDATEDELPEIEELGALVYCPGSITLKPFSRLGMEHFESDFRINVLGAVRVIQKYLPLLRKAPHASIVLYSTVAVGQGMPFHSSIASAKAAVEGLTRSLAAELAPKIRVNCVAPTLTDTDLAAGILRNDKQRESAAERHPLKMILQAEDIAGMSQFLLHDGARGMSGQVIGVDAGMSTIKL